LERNRAAWNDYEVTSKELIDAGGHVVLILHEAARLADSDAWVERDLVQVWTVRDGLAVRYRAFQTRTQALEAAGLSE
jgi:ketosteroid isomerase-like protein